MPMPSDVPQLTTPVDAAIDAAEATRGLEEAARMVQEFSAAGASGALDALLAAAEQAPAKAVEQALEIAETVAEKTTTLHGEVARFLSLTQEA